MKLMLNLSIAAAALGLGAGTAHAQAGTPNVPSTPGLQAENPTVRNGGDTTLRDIERARDEAIDKQRGKPEESAKKSRTVAAKPEDVAAGVEVHDPKGKLVGVIQSVSITSAVLKADGGAVEVPLDAFGKNDQGLLIGMSKAEFDKLVADATKPAG